VRTCHATAQALTSAMKTGQEINSKVREPAIWPANVDVNEKMKKEKISLELSLLK